MVSKLRKHVLVFAAAVVVLVLARTDVARLLGKPLNLSPGETEHVRVDQVAALQSHRSPQTKQQERTEEKVHAETAGALEDEATAQSPDETESESYEGSDGGDQRQYDAGEGYSASHSSSDGFSSGDQQESATLASRGNRSRPATEWPAIPSSSKLGLSRGRSESESTAGSLVRLQSGTAAGKVNRKRPTGKLQTNGTVGLLRVHADEQVAAADRSAAEVDLKVADASLRSNRNGSSMPASSVQPFKQNAESKKVGETVITSGQRENDSGHVTSSSQKTWPDPPVGSQPGGGAGSQPPTLVDRLNSSTVVPSTAGIPAPANFKSMVAKSNQQDSDNPTKTGLSSVGAGGRPVEMATASFSSSNSDGSAQDATREKATMATFGRSSSGADIDRSPATSAAARPSPAAATGYGVEVPSGTRSRLRSTRSPTTVAAATEGKTGARSTLRGGQLTMDALAFTDRLFLVSAYSDFRKNPPVVKIVIYAAKSFNERVYCIRAGAAHPAAHSWINYPSEELATWRAGYLECQAPDLTEQESTLELRRGGIGGASVQMPLRHSPPAAEPGAFGLCVKSGYGAPSAVRFVEWMELQSLLGVAHVILYDLNLTGPIRSAMRHYADSGLLTVVRDNSRQLIERVQPDFVKMFAGFDATKATGDEPYAQLELLSIQDCFHRFRGQYEYIVVADIDEAIVPVNVGTMQDLLQILKRKAPAATSFAHQAAAYLPSYVAANQTTRPINGSGDTYMLTHTRRTAISWEGSKTFHSTADTDSLNWHRRIRPSTNISYVDPRDAWLHHYRASCKGSSCDATATTTDDGMAVMGRFAAALSSKVLSVTRKLWPP